MRTIGIFEVKTRISEIFEEVRLTQEPIVVTRRGQPVVRIEPIRDARSEIWERRAAFIDAVGPLDEDLQIPPREIDHPGSPLE